MRKPSPTEYESEYIKYYIDLVPEENVLGTLKNEAQKTIELLSSISESQGNYKYSEGKWSLKEVIGHVIDTERIMAYRALCFSRGEENSLPGFDQDKYVANGEFATCSLKDLTDQYKTMREANLTLFKSFSETQLDAKGLANGRQVSVRTLLFMLAGHEIHHINVIKARYLKN